MTIATRRYTHQDLYDIPDDGIRYEIIGGALIVSAAPVRKHQKRSYQCTRLLGDHVDERGLDEVYYAPVDVEFSGVDVVQPDLLFIRRERFRDLSWQHRRQTTRHCPGDPLTIVEFA